MLTRDDLERLKWAYDSSLIIDEGEMYGRNLVADVMAGGREELLDPHGLLLAAAPRLAFACLSALSRLSEDYDRFSEEVELLRATLTAAGVEVS